MSTRTKRRNAAREFVIAELEAERNRGHDVIVANNNHIHEAFSVSEAVWLCTQQHLGMVIIADNLEDPETAELQRRFNTLSLKPETTVKELLWELALMLPGESAAAS
ncbi:MAG TPA: hypothetical protein VIK39_16470 [Candidatus Angelobacter sp.]